MGARAASSSCGSCELFCQAVAILFAAGLGHCRHRCQQRLRRASVFHAPCGRNEAEPRRVYARFKHVSGCVDQLTYQFTFVRISSHFSAQVSSPQQWKRRPCVGQDRFEVVSETFNCRFALPSQDKSEKQVTEGTKRSTKTPLVFGTRKPESPKARKAGLDSSSLWASPRLCSWPCEYFHSFLRAFYTLSLLVCAGVGLKRESTRFGYYRVFGCFIGTRSARFDCSSPGGVCNWQHPFGLPCTSPSGGLKCPQSSKMHSSMRSKMLEGALRAILHARMQPCPQFCSQQFCPRLPAATFFVLALHLLFQLRLARSGVVQELPRRVFSAFLQRTVTARMGLAHLVPSFRARALGLALKFGRLQLAANGKPWQTVPTASRYLVSMTKGVVTLPCNSTNQIQQNRNEQGSGRKWDTQVRTMRG